MAKLMLVVLGSFGPVAQREATSTPTAQVSGIVCLVDNQSLPVRRAVVSIYGSGETLGRHTVTDDDGRFSFERVAEGRYSISASRQGFVTIAFGAKKPGRPGSPLLVTRGQHISDVRVLLARGAAITGVVRTAVGEPIPNLDVRVDRLGLEGAQSFVTVKTDDLGQYRAFGLAGGNYLVSARPRAMGTAERAVPSDAEVDAALRELRTRTAGPRTASNAAALPEAPRLAASQMSDFVPVYHPSSFLSEDGVPVSVVAGEERAGIDILVRLMATAVVAGHVSGAEARDPGEFELTMTKMGTTGQAGVSRTSLRPGGGFSFPSVVAGRYLLVVKSAQKAQPSRPRGGCQFDAQEILVSGADRTALSLTLKPCLTILGHIDFAEGSKTTRPTDLSGTRIVLETDRAPSTPSYVPFRAPAAVEANGRFSLGELGDVMPGSYRLNVILPPTLVTQGWRPESISVDGRDATDVPIEIPTANATVIQARVLLSTERASLSGTLEPTAPLLSSDYSVVAFTTNRLWWRAPFRRVQAARPSANGHYTFQDLPPGDYHLVALTDLAPDDWRDPEFLAELVPIAMKFTLAAGEQKVQNLRIGR